MHDSMKTKLSKLEERLAEIQKLLIDTETIKDMDNYTLLNKEFADLKPIVDKFDEYNSVLAAISDANEILESGDEDLKSLAEEELKESLDKPDKLEQELKLDSFLDQLSDDEIERFKSAEDLKQMIMNLSIIKYEDKSLDEVLDIKNIDNHVIESMFKRYIDNA